MKNTAKRRVLRTIIVVLCVVLCAALAVHGNQGLKRTDYTLSGSRVPEAFDGFRIAHISDLHNAQMGKDNKNLLALLEAAQPDIIAITGDIIDSRRTDMEIALRFVREAVKIAPCYYVPGNHEARLSAYEGFQQKMIDAGVTVLEDTAVPVGRSGERIIIQGVKDPSFYRGYLGEDETQIMKTQLLTLPKEDEFTVLLSHKPELFLVYVAHGADLVLSGHAHGGQIRLPWIGGLYTPSQGLFPEYDAGMYTQQGVSMIVSRGIGNSAFPLRINNPPEVVMIELKHTEE